MKLNHPILIAVSILLLFSTRESFSQPINTKPTNAEFTKKGACLDFGKQNEEGFILRAESFYNKGKLKKSRSELRCVLMNNPMNSEAYFLLGKISYRLRNLERAVTNFRTALFWNNNLIEAHIALGNIYFKKGNCLQAKKYAVSALKIDSDNQEAMALQTQVEKCRT